MRRTCCVLFVCALLSSSSVAYAQVPKFERLRTEELKATTPAPDLKGGIVFSAGAFDLSAAPDAMLLAELNFPGGIKFIHRRLEYIEEYTDPGTGVVGYLYHL